MICMYKIAVLGDYDSIYGFMALGLSIFPVSGAEEGRQKLWELAQKDYGVIYVTEALAAGMEEDIAAFFGKPSPAIILIPGIYGNTGKGMARVKGFVEQAVGSDIL